MKKELSFLILLCTVSFSFAQESFLNGKWKYEKIPDHIEIDAQGLKMANEFFKEMTLSFDQNKYTQFVMGKSESGTWSLINNNTYEFHAATGYKYEVEIKKISSNQIIFKQKNREWQLIKSDEIAIIENKVNSLSTIVGVNIDKEMLLGTWNHNGLIKNGRDIDLILKHNEEELVNYSFLRDGTFVNMAPLEIELVAKWKIDNDNQTLIIESEDLTEFLKVTKLNETELHLYNPKIKSILKFIR